MATYTGYHSLSDLERNGDLTAVDRDITAIMEAINEKFAASITGQEVNEYGENVLVVNQESIAPDKQADVMESLKTMLGIDDEALRLQNILTQEGQTERFVLNHRTIRDILEEKASPSNETTMSDEELKGLIDDMLRNRDMDPGFTPPSSGNSRDMDPEFTPPSSGNSRDMDPGFRPPSIGNSRDMDPGFTPPSSGNSRDMDPGFTPPSSGNSRDMDPGFTPPSIGNSRDMDPGFSPPSIGNSRGMDPGFSPPSIGNSRDMDPGFSPPSIGNSRDMDPGFSIPSGDYEITDLSRLKEAILKTEEAAKGATFSDLGEQHKQEIDTLLANKSEVGIPQTPIDSTLLNTLNKGGIT